jgi:hypothetical protein
MCGGGTGSKKSSRAEGAGQGGRTAAAGHRRAAGILWNEVTGSGRPVPSEIQPTTTGTEMTAEEHVVTAETHLRYAEGHLQPSEEHLADAEVHLKLVKAHLLRLMWQSQLRRALWRRRHRPRPNHWVARPTRGGPRRHPWREREVPLTGPRRDLCSGGGSLRRETKGSFPLERGRSGRALSASVGIWRPTPWTNARGLKTYRLPRGGRRSKDGIVASAASRTAETRRQVRGVIAGSGSDGITC